MTEVIDKQYILDNLKIEVRNVDDVYFEVTHEILGLKGILNISNNELKILEMLSNNSKFLVGVIENSFKDNEIEYELSYKDRFEVADFILNEILEQI